MSITFKKAIKAASWLVVALAGVGIALLIMLIYPGTPSTGKSLEFQGYVLLPNGGTLNVLDYLTVDGKSLFVTGESTGDVYKVALHGSALPGDADVSVFAAEPATHGVVIDPLSRLAYVTRSEENTVDIFNPDSMQLVKRIPVADDPDGIFYDAFDKLIYVVSGDSKMVTLIDPASRSSSSTIDLDGKPEFAVFDSQTKLMYQNLKDTNSVVAVDVAKGTVVQRWALEHCQGPSGMAIDEASRRLFIVCSGNALLAIFDMNQQRVVATFPIGGGPDSVVYDSGLHRIYTTGKSGVMVVFQQESPDAYRVLDSIRLHYGAHTLAVDPGTHSVYVGYASLVTRPRVAVFLPRS